PPIATEPSSSGDIKVDGGDKRAVQVIGDYEIEEELDRGGMSVVYRARQRSLNRPVALKILRPGAISAGEASERFRLEAEAIARLDHSNIIPIYEVGEHDGVAYFAMKLIEGGTLAQALTRRQWSLADKATNRRSAELIATMARAVHHAHQRG